MSKSKWLKTVHDSFLLDDNGGVMAYNRIEDGFPYNRYTVQIATSDGGLWQIGHFTEEEYSFERAESAIKYALLINETYEWWQEHGQSMAAVLGEIL